ncbi:MAG: hypothetical protein AB7I59_04375 [Geminicoccaceae bacterium]
MRLGLRLTGTTLRLTGSRPGTFRPVLPTGDVLLVTEHGDVVITDHGEQLLAEPSHGQ